MNFEWDEAKRLSNIEKHGLDFLDADLLFAGPIIEADASDGHGELRWVATGLIDAIAVTIVFTRRGSAIRVISLRKARHEEKARFERLHERGA